ncbi:hypothetical protein V1517DRAFT_311927 [Lipomyces orientalis]|uniref:Uncharacterized protein n=1 Tax=Lipomyces orientalis TaxID=1233043 RepID=A0ACC3TZJ9_9ASCO
MAEQLKHLQRIEQHIFHANAIPQLQPLFTSQEGIIVRVPETGAKLRVLLEPAITCNSYIRKDVYEKHFLKGDDEADTKRELLNPYVRQPLLTSLNRTYRTSSAKIDLSASLADVRALSQPIHEGQTATAREDELKDQDQVSSSEAASSDILSVTSADTRTSVGSKLDANLKEPQPQKMTIPLKSWARIASGSFPDAKYTTAKPSNFTSSQSIRTEHSENIGVSGNKVNSETNEQNDTKQEPQTNRNMNARSISYASIAASMPVSNDQVIDTHFGTRKLKTLALSKTTAKLLDNGPGDGIVPDGYTDAESVVFNHRLDSHIEGESDGIYTANMSASSISWFDDDDDEVPSFASSLAAVNSAGEDYCMTKVENNKIDGSVESNLLLSMTDCARASSEESPTTDELTPTMQNPCQKGNVEFNDEGDIILKSAGVVTLSRESSIDVGMTKDNKMSAVHVEEIEILKASSESPITVEVTEIVMDSSESSPTTEIDATESANGKTSPLFGRIGLFGRQTMAHGITEVPVFQQASDLANGIGLDRKRDVPLNTQNQSAESGTQQVYSADNNGQRIPGAVADIWEAPSVDIALPRIVCLKVLIESLPLTLSCCVVSELFPDRNDSAGFDIIMGARAFDYLPYIWVKHDPLKGFTITQFHNRFQSAHWTASIIRDKFLSQNQILAYPPSTAAIHVWIYSVMYDRDTPICAENSAISGVGDSDSKMSDKVACGYGIYFSKESAYNNFGTCEPKSQSFHEVVALFEAIVNACTVQELKKDIIVVHTKSAYLYETAARMEEFAKRDWKTKDGQPLTNGDMWSVLYKFVNGVEVRRDNQRPARVLVVKVNKRSSKLEQEYLKGAKTLARIAAKHATMHDLEAEGVARNTIPDNATAVTLEEYERRLRNSNRNKTAPIKPSKYKISHSVDWEREHNKVVIEAKSDPILDSYRVLTGDYSFEGTGGLYFRTTPVGGMTVCIESKYIEEAWRV